MEIPVGIFDSSAVPAGWFDPTLQPGWFDESLLAPAPISVGLTGVVATCGAGTVVPSAPASVSLAGVSATSAVQAIALYSFQGVQARGLVGGGTTNLLWNSNNFAGVGSWFTGGTTKTNNVGVDQYGATTLGFVNQTTATIIHQMWQDQSTIGILPANTNYTMSAVLQPVGTQRYVEFIFDDGSSNGVVANFDLIGGTVTHSTNGNGIYTNATIASLANGNYFCTLTGKHTTTQGINNRAAIVMATSSAAVWYPSFTGVVGKGYYIGQVQLEPGLAFTVYEATAGSATTIITANVGYGVTGVGITGSVQGVTTQSCPGAQGVQSTTAAGTVTASIKYTLVGAAATSAVGNVYYAPTAVGVQSVTAVYDFSANSGANVAYTLAGVVTTTSVGSMIPSGNPPMLLGQGAGCAPQPLITNIFTQSGCDTNAGWNLGTGAARIGTTTDPFGGSNAYVYNGTAASNCYVSHSAVLVAGNTYTISVWAMIVSGSITQGVVCNVNNQFNIGLVAAGINSTWQRFQLKFRPTVNTNSMFIIGSWDIGTQLALYGAQVELGGVASTYVPTTAGSASIAQLPIGFSISGSVQTGVAATSSVGSLIPSIYGVLSGVQITSAVGTVSTGGNINFNLTGVSATSGFGSLVPNVKGVLAGVQAASAIGAVVPTLTYAITGVSSTAAVQNLTPSISITINGVQGTTGFGSILPGTSGALSGVTSNSGFGTVTPNVATTLAGVSSTSGFGTVTVQSGSSTSYQITGVSATTGFGSLIPAVYAVISGTFGTGSVQALIPRPSASLNGVLATGYAQTVSYSITSNSGLTGVVSITNAGSVIGQGAQGKVLTGVSAVGNVAVLQALIQLVNLGYMTVKDFAAYVTQTTDTVVFRTSVGDHLADATAMNDSSVYKLTVGDSAVFRTTTNDI